MSKSANASVSIGLGGAMFLLFLGLRLTDHIDWAWYWVAAPLWVPTGLFLGIVGVIAVFAGIAYGIGAIGGAAKARRRSALAKKGQWR